jgi:ferredoxin
MFGSRSLSIVGAAVRNDHAACSGCSLCLLVCPVWRRTHDPRMTPEGRAKALQHGASAAQIADSVQSCTLCGACEPVCPEEIGLVGMTLDLRARLADGATAQALQSKMETKAAYSAAPISASVVLLPGPAMRAQPEALARIAALLGGAPCADDGADIAQAIESGVPVPANRLDAFLAHLRGARTIVVEDGLWMRSLREWLPKARLVGFGESLSSLPAVRRGLRKSDLYVIEPRSYHGDYERLVKHYDRLRAERGCAFNLDLQRIAIPAAGQADWILKGRSVDRIVVERLEDGEAFGSRGGLPVVHVAELADH